MNVQIARNEFRTKINDVYSDIKGRFTGFFTSLATVKTTSAKTVGAEVMRGYEKVAIDVKRGASSNRNEASISSQKFFEPPYYNEDIDFTSLDGYDRMFGANADVDINVLDRFTEQAAFEVEMMINKIARAKEIQGASVFDDGIVSLNASTDIDFKRTATSKPDIGSGDAQLYWNGSSADIIGNLNTGAEYIRQVGKSGEVVFDVVMGTEAWEYFRKDSNVEKFLNFRHSDVIELSKNRPPQNGATPKCIFGPDSFTYNIWVMNVTYDNSSNVATQYWNSKKVCMYPADVRITLDHAGIPTAYKLNSPGWTNNSTIQNGVFFQEGEYVVDDYISPTGDSHILRVRSAPLYKLVSVDRIYSMKVLA